MEASSQKAAEGEVPKDDSQGASWDQEEMLLAEDQAGKCSTQEGDLCGGATAGRMTPPGQGSWGCGLGVSPSPGGRHSTGAGPVVQEPCGPASSQDPDLVTPQGPHGGEGPSQSTAGARNCDQAGIRAQHHRSSPGEKTPVCDHCGGHSWQWSCPGAQLHDVHVDCQPCEMGAGSQACRRVLQQTSFQRIPSVKQPRAGVCSKAFAKRALLAPQEQMQAAGEPHLCASCGKHLGHKEQQPRGEAPSVCPDCNQASGPHAKAGRSPAQRRYKCDECGKAFTRTSSLLQHERIHTGERPYECAECGKAFVRCSGLYRHQKTHLAEKCERHRRGPALNRRHCLLGSPPCGDCGSRGTGRTLVAGEKPYECTECAKAFSLFSHLVEHRRVHTGEKPYTCPECGKAFNQRSNLSRHQRTHSSAKPYACQLCEKAFKGRSGLVQHQRAHTGERPYSCPECGKTFRGCSELRQHERLHSGEKPFICRDCGKAFVRNCSLVRHLRTHTGERPYACGECGRTFSQRSNLNEHQKRHADRALP